MAYEIGTLCTKSNGRDAGLWCVIVDLPKDGYALVDGQTRRRTVNIAHIIPSDKKVKLKKGASHSEVAAVLKALKIEVHERKPKKATERPLKQRRLKKAEAKRESKKVDKAAKKVEAKKQAEAKKAAKAAAKAAPVAKAVPATKAATADKTAPAAKVASAEKQPAPAASASPKVDKPAAKPATKPSK